MIQPLTESFIELAAQHPVLFWPLLLCVVAGFALGLLFFGSLWWTVQWLARLQHPALWLMAGFLLRISMVLAGMYWLSDGQWPRLLACLTGFLLARLAVFWFTGRRLQTATQGEKTQQKIKGASHAAES